MNLEELARLKIHCERPCEPISDDLEGQLNHRDFGAFVSAYIAACVAYVEQELQDRAAEQEFLKPIISTLIPRG